jgi:hypothetical protein
MLRGPLILAVLLFQPLIVAPVLAQDRLPADSEFCGETVGLERLSGVYEVQSIATVVSLNGVPMMERPSETHEAHLLPIDEEMHLLDLGEPFSSMRLSLAGPDEPDWRWSDETPLSGVDSEDMELVVGCEIAELPRLVGTYENRSEDGYPLFHTIRLVALDDGWLFGQYENKSPTEQGLMTATTSLVFHRTH